MSVHLIYYQQGHKMMEAVGTEETYRRYRDSQAQKRWVETIRHPKPETDVSAAKRKLVQFNYSCLPTKDGCLKGAKRLSKSVGMDIDHLSVDEVNLVAATAIEKKDELGLLMLERSARGGGLHVVFRRHPEMDHGRPTCAGPPTCWAWSMTLGQRTSPASSSPPPARTCSISMRTSLTIRNAERLRQLTRRPRSLPQRPPRRLPLRLLRQRKRANGSREARSAPMASETTSAVSETVSKPDGQSEEKSQTEEGETTSKEADETTTEEQEGHTGEEASEAGGSFVLQGHSLRSHHREMVDLYNEGEHPIRSNRNTLTFELAVNLRNICDFDRELMARVIPCYDGFPEAEKLACINSALSEKQTQMPRRLRDVIEAVRQDMKTEDKEDAAVEAMLQDDLQYYNALPKMPQGVRESISAVGRTSPCPPFSP